MSSGKRKNSVVTIEQKLVVLQWETKAELCSGWKKTGIEPVFQRRAWKKRRAKKKRQKGNENEKKEKITTLKTNVREGKCVCEKVSKALCGWKQQVLKLVLCGIVPSVPSLVGSIKKEMERRTILIVNKAPSQPNTKEINCVEIRKIFLPWSATWLCQSTYQNTEQWIKMSDWLVWLLTGVTIWGKC